MVRDYFESRTRPSFDVNYAENGEKGLQMILNQTPNIVILDVKMPVKDGREVYREIKRRGISIPVIIFFDAISGEEISEIHKIGRPAIAEKGSQQSSPSELMALVKKMIYFA